MNEKIFFKNSKGDRLCGILSGPKSGKEKSIAILCHGSTSSKNSSMNLEFEKILNKNNVSVFRFDLYGHGESDGKFEELTISELVDDILSAVKLAKKLGYGKISLYGSSLSGMPSIIAASKSQDITALALKAPVSDYLSKMKHDYSKSQLENWKKKGFIVYRIIKGAELRRNYSFLKDVSKLNGYKEASKIKIPVLIVHGDKDTAVPLKQSRKTCAMIGNCRLEVIKGADHLFSKPKDFDKAIELISEFIIEHS